MTDKHPAAVPETKDQVHPASDSDRGDTDFQAIARLFHDTYERLAPQFGYETRKDTRQFDPDAPNGKLMIAVCSEVLRGQARMAESHEHAGEQDGQLSQCGPHTDATHQDGPVSPAPDKALPEPFLSHDPEDVQEWINHMDLHLTEHDNRHAGLALRSAWPHVRAFLFGAMNERNTWKELVTNAESALTAERQKNEGLARTISVLRGPEPVRADALDIVGGQFAIKFTDGCDNGCVQLYSEDDGWWHCKDEGFSALWLGDLKSVVDRAIDAALSRQGADSER